METIDDLFQEEIPLVQQQWRKVYIIGGYTALLSFFITLFDIIFGSISSSNLSVLPQTAIERFSEFQQHSLLGLYHLDLLNVINAIVMITTYFALFALHRKKNISFAAFAMVISFIGTAIFISANSALPMLELSSKYYSIVDETQRMLIAAAGEALLVRGVHGSLGAFMGFAFLTIAAIAMSLVMLQGKIFSKKISSFGIIGNTLLLIYILLVTFVPSIENIAVILAAPGGILSLVWTLMIGVKLIKM